jgi:hypothetical protein
MPVKRFEECFKIETKEEKNGIGIDKIRYKIYN